MVDDLVGVWFDIEGKEEVTTRKSGEGDFVKRKPVRSSTGRQEIDPKSNWNKISHFSRKWDGGEHRKTADKVEGT